LAEDSGERLILPPIRFTPGNNPSINWSGSRDGLDVWMKRNISCLNRNSNPGPSSP